VISNGTGGSNCAQHICSSSPVDLLGHSYGGNVAFGAATLTTNIRKLVLYEGWPLPNIAHRTVGPEAMDHLESLLAAGQARAGAGGVLPRHRDDVRGWASPVAA
jgi:pimeloyl-ACP methyl ester carboxylesterase